MQLRVGARPASGPTEWPLRPGFLIVALVAAAGFVVDTYAALTYSYLPFDLPIELAIQRTDFGVLSQLFNFFTFLGGLYQLAVAVAAVGLVFLLNRPAGPLMLMGALTGVWYQTLNIVIHRARPDAHLVHVTSHVGGYGYPSGHVAFYTAFTVLLLLCLGYQRLPKPLLIVGFALCATVVALSAISRMYVGAHWPSDCLGGLLLGIAWIALSLSIRKLSDPVLK